MEGRAKVTKEVLCEEARFILANVMAEARYGRQNRYDDIRRVCEGAVSIPFQEYIGFLEKSGYLQQNNGSLEVTADGEQVVNGSELAEFTERAVAHFKKLRQSRTQGVAVPERASITTNSGVVASTLGRETSGQVRAGGSKVQHSGGQPSAVVRGEIHTSAEIVDSRYEKLASMGSGGIGTVYRAR